jgi:hypothetical protein
MAQLQGHLRWCGDEGNEEYEVLCRIVSNLAGFLAAVEPQNLPTGDPRPSNHVSGGGHFDMQLADYLVRRENYNGGQPGDASEVEQDQLMTALGHAWKLRPSTRAEGIDYARFMIEELEGGIPTDVDNFADAVEATLRALLIEQRPSTIAKRVGEARFNVENAQGDIRAFRGLFFMMADAIGSGGDKAVELNAEDYRCALYTFANQAEALARALEDPIKELMAAEHTMEGKA